MEEFGLRWKKSELFVFVALVCAGLCADALRLRGGRALARCCLNVRKERPSRRGEGEVLSGYNHGAEM